EGRTKDRHVLCVETSDAGLVGLLGPCSWGGGRKMTKDLVRAGVHPLDIIIGSEADGRWTFRTAVDWMFWTAEDQDALEDPQTAS
ncbi:hypothetical protein, partial [Starkeya nomas]|uniref:hypothetical protein n=1 Tax=Starkeya nomas TaxID=2666134 RepID=UPI001AED8E74